MRQGDTTRLSLWCSSIKQTWSDETRRYWPCSISKASNVLEWFLHQFFMASINSFLLRDQGTRGVIFKIYKPKQTLLMWEIRVGKHIRERSWMLSTLGPQMRRMQIWSISWTRSISAQKGTSTFAFCSVP